MAFVKIKLHNSCNKYSTTTCRMEENILSHVSDKGFVFRIYKEPLHINNKKMNSPVFYIFFGRRSKMDFSPRKLYKCSTNTLKILDIIIHQENTNQNHIKVAFHTC